jgi:hypothetical protein
MQLKGLRQLAVILGWRPEGSEFSSFVAILLHRADSPVTNSGHGTFVADSSAARIESVKHHFVTPDQIPSEDSPESSHYSQER